MTTTNNTTCEQLGDRLMDLLYGELAAEERPLVEAHLAGCARCRAEVEGFRQTRALMRGAFDEAPPARAHAGILAAAAAQLRASPQRERERPRASWMDWLRTRWTLPTLATIGAVAVFLLSSRIFLDPRRTAERGRAGLFPAEAPVPPGASAVRPAPVPPLVAPDPALGESRGSQTARLDRAPVTGGEETSSRRRAAAAHGIGMSPSGRAEAAPAPLPMKKGAGAVARSKDRGDQPADGFAEPEREFAPPPPPRAAAEPSGALGGMALDQPAPARPRAEAKAKRPAPMREEESLGKAASGGGGPASGASPYHAVGDHRADDRDEQVNAPASAGAERAIAESEKAAPAKAKKESRGAAMADEDLPARETSLEAAKPRAKAAAPAAPTPAAPAPASPAPSRAPAPATAFSSPPPSATAAPASAFGSRPQGSATASSEAAPARDKAKSAKADQAPETLIQRADRLFAERRWVEATAAYRELLRQDPRNDDAARWRRRLATAEAERQAAGASDAAAVRR